MTSQNLKIASKVGGIEIHAVVFQSDKVELPEGIVREVFIAIWSASDNETPDVLLRGFIDDDFVLTIQPSFNCLFSTDAENSKRLQLYAQLVSELGEVLAILGTAALPELFNAVEAKIKAIAYKANVTHREGIAFVGDMEKKATMANQGSRAIAKTSRVSARTSSRSISIGGSVSGSSLSSGDGNTVLSSATSTDVVNQNGGDSATSVSN